MFWDKQETDDLKAVSQKEVILDPNKEISPKKKRITYIPTAFTIIAILMVFFIIVSWIGKATGATTMVPEAIRKGGKIIGYKSVSKDVIGMGLLDAFVAVWHGFVDKAAIIGFIFTVGAMLAIMTRTKAIDAGLEKVIAKLNGKEIWMIPVLMFLFGLGGTVYGMWEETIAFFPILIPIFIKAGFGPITAVFVVLLGCGAGNMSSAVNPFAVGIATSTANAATKGSIEPISVGTMMGTRWILFIIFEAVTTIFVVLFAKKIKAGNIVKGVNVDQIQKKFHKDINIDFTWKRKVTVALFTATFLIMILSYLPWFDWINGNALDGFNNGWNKTMFWLATSSPSGDAWASWGTWYLISVSGLFMLVTVIVFALNHNDFMDKPTTEQESDVHWKPENKERVFISTYMNGTKDVLPVCLTIGFAAGLGYILSITRVGPWLANSISSIGSLGFIGFGIVLFIMSLALGMLMPSSSGFAAAFIPIFALIAAKAFPNQPAVVAYVIVIYILAEGIANLVTPTNAALVAYTEYCGVPYLVWMKQIWKLMVGYFIGSIIIVIIIGAMLMGGVVV